MMTKKKPDTKFNPWSKKPDAWAKKAKADTKKSKAWAKKAINTDPKTGKVRDGRSVKSEAHKKAISDGLKYYHANKKEASRKSKVGKYKTPVFKVGKQVKRKSK